MEKIQKALAKARQERSGQVPPPRTITPRRAETVANHDASPADAAWAALPRYAADKAHLMRHRVVTESGGAPATPFDMMRTKILQQMKANSWRRLAITSPAPACGKSTITANLAFSLARQVETRAIVAEMDMRRPSLGRVLNLRPDTGFADVLAGTVSFEHQAVCHNGNLALSVNPGPVRGPTELIQSSSAVQCLEQLEATYQPDLMLFDMPPMLGGDDVMAFAGNVDCVLIIGAAESTTTKEIDICEREIASQTNVMGVVLNKCRYMDKETSYSYYG